MPWQPLEQSTPYRNNKPITLPENETQWKNDLYVVNRTVVESENPEVGPMIYLSIRNEDRSTHHDWRDFQRIKNQLAGPEYEGVEIYPAESRLVDTANQYHLWCYPFQLQGMGFFEGRIVARQAQVDNMTPGAKQRDPEEIDLKYGGLSKMKDLKQWLDSGTGQSTEGTEVEDAEARDQ